MAKKKGKRRTHGIEMPAFKPPSPEQQLGAAADHVARVAVEVHPQAKKLHDDIRARVLKAAKVGRTRR